MLATSARTLGIGTIPFIEPSARDRRPDLAHALVLVREFSVHATESALRVCRAPTVTNSEIAVLIRLAASDELRPRDLRLDVPLTSGGMANLLGRLERQGLVVRRTGRDGDRRAVTVAVTELGRDRQQCVGRAMTQSLLQDEAVLKEVIESLRDAGVSAAEVVLPPAPDSAGRITLGLARLGVVIETALGPSHRTSRDTLNDAVALAALVDGGSTRPNRLGEVLGVTSGGTSRLIDRLEAAGLAGRVALGEDDDGRGVLVDITDAGRDHLSALLDRIAPHYDELLGILELLLRELSPGRGR